MRLCTVDGCGRRYSARGYCTMHYQRFMRHGDPGPASPLPPRRYGRNVDRWACDCPAGTPTETCGPLFPRAHQCARCKRRAREVVA